MNKFIEVVLNIPVLQSFTYKAPPNSTPEPGKRAEVFFGNRKMTAFIINIMDTLPQDLPIPENSVKTALRIIDDECLFNDELIGISRWLSNFYLCSQGEALSSMLPSGRREVESGSLAFEDENIEFHPHTLSEEQKAAVENITKNTDSFAMHYVFGATGTGKTEVFLQTAETILSHGKGVIYLVPEIALTHQVIEAVTHRFGKIAAVLHSGLTPSQKLFEWKRILHREARVVIGARSAVFAPVPDLGLIIIDEEHDGSYKSGTTPRYNGRQVAVKRCSDLHIPLIMGSATPSAETWYLMQTGVISKHVLSKRLSGGSPPQIQIVDLSQNPQDGCISAELADEILTAKKENRQTILFLNKRGFSHFFKCNTCGYELKCKNCSVSMTFHKKENKFRCHYCGWTTNPPAACPECGSIDISYSGFGTEFIEQEIAVKFPELQLIRLDTDSLLNKNELKEKLSNFRNKKADILLGTQKVAKGLNFPGVKLVGIINADTGLNMPDFRASERTHALIVQVAGRAGRFFPDGKVIVQTWNPQRPAIHFACTGQCESFYEQEIQMRKVLNFPPFSRMIRLVFRSKNPKDAENAAISACKILKSASSSIRILGPAECAIFQLSGNYRFQLLLQDEKIGPIQNFCRYFLANYKPLRNVYLEIDVDPVALL